MVAQGISHPLQLTDGRAMMGHDHYEARAPLVGASDRRLQLSPTMAKVAAVALGLAFS